MGAGLILNSRGSRPDIRCGQGVKHEILMGQDLDPGRGWKYRCLWSVPPLASTQAAKEGESSLVPRPHPLRGKRGLVNMDAFLGLTFVGGVL